MSTLTLTPAVADALVEAVRQGVPYLTAAQAAGINRQTAQWWLMPERGLVDFMDAIAQARAEWEQDRVKSILEDAKERNSKTGLRDWRASLELLKHSPWTRERWHEYREVHTTTTQLPAPELLRIDELAAAEGVDALDALEREILALPPPAPPAPAQQ